MLQCLLLLCLWAVCGTAGQCVTINEVMFDPATSERSDEFIEILNLSDSLGVDLQGWCVGDDQGLDAIVDAGQGLWLGPGQYGVILDGDYFAYSAIYGGLIPASALILTIDGNTLGSGGLSNSQPERVALWDDRGEEVSGYLYSTGNRPGHSDEKINPFGTNSAENWADSAQPGGTPGLQNSVYRCVEISKVALRITPNPFSPNGDGFEDEAVLKIVAPFNQFSLSVLIYTLTGRRIRSLCSARASGVQTQLLWDGRDDSGRNVDLGLYLVYVEALSAVNGTRVALKEGIVISR